MKNVFLKEDVLTSEMENLLGGESDGRVKVKIGSIEIEVEW